MEDSNARKLLRQLFLPLANILSWRVEKDDDDGLEEKVWIFNEAKVKWWKEWKSILTCFSFVLMLLFFPLLIKGSLEERIHFNQRHMFSLSFCIVWLRFSPNFSVSSSLLHKVLETEYYLFTTCSSLTFIFFDGLGEWDGEWEERERMSNSCFCRPLDACFLSLLLCNFSFLSFLGTQIKVPYASHFLGMKHEWCACLELQSLSPSSFPGSSSSLLLLLLPASQLLMETYRWQEERKETIQSNLNGNKWRPRRYSHVIQTQGERGKKYTETETQTYLWWENWGEVNCIWGSDVSFISQDLITSFGLYST